MINSEEKRPVAPNAVRYSFAVRAAYCLRACRLRIRDKTLGHAAACAARLRASDTVNQRLRDLPRNVRTVRAQLRPVALVKRSWIEILFEGKNLFTTASGERTNELIITFWRAINAAAVGIDWVVLLTDKAFLRYSVRRLLPEQANFDKGILLYNSPRDTF